jgi:hypothetical protein
MNNTLYSFTLSSGILSEGKRVKGIVHVDSIPEERVKE